MHRALVYPAPLLLISGLLLAGAGCVVVNPSNVSVGSPHPIAVGEPKPTTAKMAYGESLRHVLKQQQEVNRHVGKREWREIAEENTHTIDYTRELAGYANTAWDPPRFRHYCDQLLQHMRALSDAAVRHDSAGCDQSRRAIDSILDQFSRDFPVAAVPPPRSAPPPVTPPVANASPAQTGKPPRAP